MLYDYRLQLQKNTMFWLRDLFIRVFLSLYSTTQGQNGD